MTNESEHPQPQATTVESAAAESERPQGLEAPSERPRSDRRVQPSDDRRRKRGPGQERKSPSGYGDGIERAICLFFRHVGPATFPVQSRQGLATSRPTEVARRLDSVLLCDRNHEGDCVWPDGSIAFEDKRAPGPADRPPESHQPIDAEDSSAQSVEQLEVTPISQHLEIDPAEQPTGGEPEAGSSDENWDGSGISDEDR
jgi:hypothetical protein